MEIYIVREGDTLESIARYFNIPATEIIKANSLEEPYILKVNDSLSIPTSVSNIFNYYTIKNGDTLYKIASDNNISVNNLAEINGLDVDEYIYPGQTLLIPKEGIITYITEMGDTISSVSRFFNTTPQELMYNNNNIYLLPEQLIVFRRQM